LKKEQRGKEKTKSFLDFAYANFEAQKPLNAMALFNPTGLILNW
jgi:hypothetical protein